MRLMHACDIAQRQIEELTYPVYVSPKLDGIRFVKRKNRLQSRTLRELPNVELQYDFRDPILDNLEGEIIVGDPMDKSVFKKTQSYVMSRYKKKDMLDNASLYVFDIINKPDMLFKERYELLKELSISFPKGVFLLEQTLVYTPKELFDFEAESLSKGAEGIMIRNPDSMYKYGDSTLNKMELIKFKRFNDSEAVIVKVNPYEFNSNGMGSLTVKDIKSGIEFGLGSGFTIYEREHFWKKRSSIVGKIIKYKYSKTGGYEKPRFPVFLGTRDPMDIIDLPDEFLIANN